MGNRKRQLQDMARRDTQRMPTVYAAEPPTETERQGREVASLRSISVFKLQPHRLQPSVRHSAENVADLRVSIEALGLQEPPLVWRKNARTYVILFGHRRIRACQLAALDGRIDEKIRVFVRTDLTEAQALAMMAAEYFHRREFGTLHIAKLIGETSRHMARDENGEIPARELAAVLPWGRTSVRQYLTIYDALQDPRLAPLVHRVDKAPKSLLYKILAQEEFSTRAGALQVYVEKGEAAARKVISAGNGGRPLKTVTRRERGGGWDTTVRIRPTMSKAEIEEARQGLEKAVEDLRTIPREARPLELSP